MEDYIQQVIELVDLKQNRPLHQIVFEGLRKAIITGVIPVGERINEKEYAQKMNISRTPIREALRRIEDEGLVEYIPRYGTVVKKVTIADVEEIFKIREALEIVAATNAMTLMTEEDFRVLKRLIDATEKANQDNEIDKVIQYFGEFNNMLYSFSRMPRLESIVVKLKDYLKRFRDISATGNSRRQQAILEHFYIYRAMRNKDVEQVTMIIEEHLGRSKQYIIEEMTAQSSRETGGPE